MQSINARIERSLIKIFLVLVGSVVLLSVAAYFGMRILRAWQERRLLAQAHALVNEGDLKRASFNAQRVLQLDPKSAGANRVMAEVGEHSGLRAAIDFRRRAAELSKNDEYDLLAWARSSLRFGDAANAAKALESLPPALGQTAEYHALQANLALLRRDFALSETELSRAVELDPANKNYRLALATAHLSSTDRSIHERGRHELIELQSDPALRREVTRRLADDALRRSEKDQALKYARQLRQFSENDFSDRLLLLTVLKQTEDPEAEPLLRQLQKEAGEDAARISALLGWMNAHKMSSAAVAWIQTLPPELLAKKTLPLMVADAFLADSDWIGLQKFLGTSSWPTMEYLRCALLARALQELGRRDESTQQWQEATSKVEGHSEEIFLLADMVKRWGWEKEALELLWLAAKDPQNASQTLGALYNLYAARGDTSELYRVLLHLQELRPNDSAILNNIAQLSLLLRLNTERGHELARQVYEQDPKNADYASTYAFSLSLRGENKKAVQVFADLSNADLHRPQIAAYFGIILAAASDLSRAREFLDLGARANLLPEERALLEKAQLRLAQR